MLYKDNWLSAGLVDEFAKLTKSHPRTVQRWIERSLVPDTAYELIDIVQNGNLGKIDQSWRGWRICQRNGCLWTPNGEQVHLQRIMALRYRMAQLECLKRRLSAETSHLDDSDELVAAVR